MYEKLSKKTTQIFIRLGIINTDDFDIYKYGFELIISSTSIIFSILFFSILLDKTLETIFFLIGFFNVRAICGGYHGKSHFSCFILSIATYILFLVLYQVLFEIDYIFCFISFLVIFSIVILVVFAPVENPNNPMTYYRKKKNKVLTILFSTMILFILSIHFISNEVNIQTVSFFLGVFIATLTVFAAKLENLIKRRNL